MIYEVVIIEGSRVDALVFFNFPTNSLMNPDVFFSLKPSKPQKESFLKNFSSLGNKQTHKLIVPIALEAR